MRQSVNKNRNKRNTNTKREKDAPIEEVIEDIQEQEVNETVEEVDETTEIEERENEPEEFQEEEAVDDIDGSNENSKEENDIEEEETPIEEHIIEGYAIVFDELSEDLGGFREVIRKEAVTEDLIKESDIFYLFNHDDNSIPLARSKNGKGSLKLTIDEKGLKYSFNCLNSEFYEIVKRGDLDKSSFAFTLPKDGSGEEWVKHKEYNYIRYITKIEKLFDCSAVLNPAYQATSLYARSKKTKEVADGYYKPYEMIIESFLK